MSYQSIEGALKFEHAHPKLLGHSRESERTKGPTIMPIGSHHDETGILVRDGELLYLQRDAGGHWQIDAPDKATNLIGHRVRIVGVRTGFDRLSAKQITEL